MDLFNTGVRPAIDEYLKQESEKIRDYGNYWSASSAGYCQRKVIFDRLKLPPVTDDPRKTRVFSSGHIFHEWIQGITQRAGISVAQEVELKDDKLMIIGHFDDLIKVDDHFILYDYKTQHSRAFMWAKKNPKPMSHYHKMQLGTYMYMLRSKKYVWSGTKDFTLEPNTLSEARIMKISKDDLMMTEQALLWTPDLEKKVYEYWTTLNGYWNNKKLPSCTCAKYENGFMADPKYNPYYYNSEPCSLDYFKKFPELIERWRNESIQKEN